jgi:hypothetical protein
MTTSQSSRGMLSEKDEGVEFENLSRVSSSKKGKMPCRFRSLKKGQREALVDS